VKLNLQQKLESALKDALEKLGLSAYIPELILDIPSDSRFGDLTTNIGLRIAKAIKKPHLEVSAQIAAALSPHLERGALKNEIKEIRAEGAGFLNFYLTDAYFQERLKQLLLCPPKLLGINIGKGNLVLLEFVSANPTGSLSVAHARQGAVGDILANILAFCGFRVKREFYLNDVGNQINILGDSVNLRMKELNGEKVEFPQNYYQGDYIYDIARKVQGARCKVQDLGEFAANYILDIIKKELDDFGVKFDCWYSQKKLEQSGKVKKGLEFLKKKGFIYELEGALWFKSTAFGDDKDRVVIKSDGAYTYLAPDIAYHRDKYKRGFQWLINLWGPDHHGYIPRMKAAVQALGEDKNSLSIIIVQLATIFREGKPVQMSTRKGQYITLREILDEVGKDAARFFFVMRRTSSHLDFDLDVAKKHTPENPVFYVQYAHARISSILRNSSAKLNYKKIDFALLKEKEELLLVKKILQFSYILNICVATQDPYMLTVYLQELAESFHKFYDLHRVLGDNPSLTQARLALIEATKITIAQGLKLLGVSQPQEM
jgi:arginyl-tRNA synthetase